MPRKVPTEHRHEPPSERGVAPIEQPKPFECPNNERIAALERQFEAFQAMLSERPEQLPAVIDDDGHTEQRFQMMTRQITTLREQVEEVRNLPRLSPDDVNSLSTALNTRVGQMIEDAITKEVTQLKIRLSSMERTSAPSLAKDVEQLGRIVTETGKLVASLDERGHMYEQELNAARGDIKTMHAKFNREMARALSAVVQTFEGAPA